MSGVADMYFDLIKKGVTTLDDVPDMIKDVVEDMIEQKPVNEQNKKENEEC